MSAIDTCLARNAAYADGFDAGTLPAPPAMTLAVVTCMDARIDAHAMLGLAPGDAHVIRNAGGLVTDDAIRSLTISQHFLGSREIMVVQHTNCGMCSMTDDEMRDAIEESTGTRPALDLGTFQDLEGNVRAAVARLRESPLIPHTDAIRGFVYDVGTGRLGEVR